MNAEKLLGGKAIPMPDASNPEKLAEWEGWKALGVPDAPEGYKVERPQLAEGIEWDENAEKSFREFAHKKHFTPDQFQAGIEFYASLMNGQGAAAIAQTEAQFESVKAELKKEWGEPEFLKRVDAGRAAIRHYATDENGKPLADDKMIQRLNLVLGDKGTMKFFSDVGLQLAEKGLMGGQKVSSFGVTIEQAKAQKAAKFQDKGFTDAYNDKTHPGHQGAVDEMLRLNSIIEGETGV